MKQNDDGGVIDDRHEPARDDRIERRTLLKGLATGLAGVAATPHTTAFGRTMEPAAQAPAQPADPAVVRFLDDHQRQTLTSLAESLVPGSVAAGVVDLIDRVALVDTPARQRQLLNAIGRFEREARTAHGSRWVDLDEAARHGLLRQASQGPESRPRQPVWVKGEPLVFAASGPPPPETLRDQFDYLRSAVSGAYYATDAGRKELGWTGRTVWTELPACTHPNPEH